MKMIQQARIGDVITYLDAQGDRVRIYVIEVWGLDVSDFHVICGRDETHQNRYLNIHRQPLRFESPWDITDVNDKKLTLIEISE